MAEQEDKEGERVEVKTAPQLAPELRKKIGVTGADEPETGPAKPKAAAKKSAAATKAGSAKSETTDEPAPDASDEELMKRSTDLEDDRTDEAVKDIVSYEGDVMLAVADSTAEARNRGVEGSDEDEGKGRSFFSIVMWTLIIFIVIVAVVAVAVFATGTDVSGLK